MFRFQLYGCEFFLIRFFFARTCYQNLKSLSHKSWFVWLDYQDNFLIPFVFLLAAWISHLFGIRLKVWKFACISLVRPSHFAEICKYLNFRKTSFRPDTSNAQKRTWSRNCWNEKNKMCFLREKILTNLMLWKNIIKESFAAQFASFKN